MHTCAPCAHSHCVDHVITLAATGKIASRARSRVYYTRSPDCVSVSAVRIAPVAGFMNEPCTHSFRAFTRLHASTRLQCLCTICLSLCARVFRLARMHTHVVVCIVYILHRTLAGVRRVRVVNVVRMSCRCVALLSFRPMRCGFGRNIRRIRMLFEHRMEMANANFLIRSLLV